MLVALRLADGRERTSSAARAAAELGQALRSTELLPYDAFHLRLDALGHCVAHHLLLGPSLARAQHSCRLRLRLGGILLPPPLPAGLLDRGIKVPLGWRLVFGIGLTQACRRRGVGIAALPLAHGERQLDQWRKITQRPVVEAIRQPLPAVAYQQARAGRRGRGGGGGGGTGRACR